MSDLPLHILSCLLHAWSSKKAQCICLFSEYTADCPVLLGREYERDSSHTPGFRLSCLHELRYSESFQPSPVHLQETALTLTALFSEAQGAFKHGQGSRNGTGFLKETNFFHACNSETALNLNTVDLGKPYTTELSQQKPSTSVRILTQR